MKILGIIPARFGSSRFPGKALADIGGKPMVVRVWEQACQCKALDRVLVATDHPQIYEAVNQAGGEAVMTSSEHPSGTDRCFEAYQKIGQSYDYVVNIQGDEPFINPEQINELTTLLDGETPLATLAKPLKDREAIFSPNTVKVVFDANGYALYFSRASLPYYRNLPQEQWVVEGNFYKHIGLYAYRSDVLKAITRLQPSRLEQAESLEQLRWLENGYRIRVATTELETLGIDTPEDLEKALKLYLS
jgi:3-deoxy-manno-octulosonate cytidylyltransferase (CMP-KDO synthetase)